MGGHTDAINRAAFPPRLAYSLLRFATAPANRPALLGDLHEQFLHRTTTSPRAARAWYWKQAVRSLPHIAWSRLRSPKGKNIALLILTTVFAVIMTSIWDRHISRASVQYIAAQPNAPSLLVMRSLYFAVQSVGIGLAGSIIAGLTFDKNSSFVKNVFYRLGPTLLLFLTVSTISLSSREGGFPALYLAIRIGLAIPALLVGARLASQLMGKTQKLN